MSSPARPERMVRLRRAAARKAVHALLACLSLAPAALPGLFPLPTQSVYAAALVVAAWLNAVKIWGPPPLIARISRIPVLEAAFRPINLAAARLWGALTDLEREYERRLGWVGLLNGIIGVSAAYLISGEYSAYGVAAMATVDVFSTLVGEALPSAELPASRGATVCGTAAGALSYMALLLTVLPPAESLVLAAAAGIIEAYGIEDNVDVPLLTSILAAVAGYPPPRPLSSDFMNLFSITTSST